MVMVMIAGLMFVVLLSLRKERRSVAGRGWPVNLAHRGASASAPENTLEAFRLAVESGAGGLELDVHMTRDGEIVVLHDPTVDRTTEGTGPVSGMSLSEVRRLDAGYRFASDGAHPYRGKGVLVPTLAEVFREFPEVVVNMDIKEHRPGFEEAVLREIWAAGAGGRTLVASWDFGTIRRFRRLSGGLVPTAASRFEIGAFYVSSRLRLERLLRPAYDALQVPVRHRGLELVTRRFLDAAHDRGVRVDAWTIDEAGEMRRLLDLGVDGIMSDRPGVLEEVLRERGP